jgi:hypothetical protein
MWPTVATRATESGACGHPAGRRLLVLMFSLMDSLVADMKDAEEETSRRGARRVT